MGDLVFLKLGPRRGFRRATSAIDWYERGLALEVTDPAGAMAAYRRALAARSDLADAYNNLGRLHHDRADAGQRGELADAEALYRLAICAGGNVALYWFNLGVALEDQGRAAESIAAYEQALALDPCFADAHFNLARQLEVRGRAGHLDELVLRRAINHLKRYRDLVRAG